MAPVPQGKPSTGRRLSELAERWAHEAAEREQPPLDEQPPPRPAGSRSALDELHRDRDAYEDQPRPSWRQS